MRSFGFGDETVNVEAWEPLDTKSQLAPGERLPPTELPRRFCLPGDGGQSCANGVDDKEANIMIGHCRFGDGDPTETSLKKRRTSGNSDPNKPHQKHCGDFIEGATE